MKLPSKLTSFEQFLFFDDYPAYPNTIGCRLQLCGPLDESQLLEAHQRVCARNPLLNSSLEMRRRRPVWTHQRQEAMSTRLTDKFVEQPFLKWIDLEKEPGGQLHWAYDGEQAGLNFLTHHATADGIGGLQVVLDWLTAYHALNTHNDAQSRELEKKLRRLDPNLLDRRARYGFCRWRFLKTIPRQALGIFGVKEFIANRPVRLIDEPPGPVDQPIPADYPGVLSTEFGDINRLQRRAEAEGVTTNDLILQCIFVAIAKWRRANSLGSDQDLIRVMVPINLRTISDRYLPASHRSSIVTLDRKQERCTQENAFLNTIKFQMNVIKANELGYTFLHFLNFSRWLPRGIKRFADPNRIGATVLVTNLGEPFKRCKLPRNSAGKIQLGQTTLESIQLLAPLRPNTQAAFAIHRYAGKTFLTLTYDNRVIQPESASSLTDLVRSEFQHQLSTLT